MLMTSKASSDLNEEIQRSIEQTFWQRDILSIVRRENNVMNRPRKDKVT